MSQSDYEIIFPVYAEYRLIKHIPRRIISAIDLELLPFLKPDDDEDCINGHELRHRAIELEANYGHEDAEWLVEQQNQLSTEFRPFHLLFPATIRKDLLTDEEYITCLEFSNGLWQISSLWLALDFDSHDRLVRPKRDLYL